jgi:uncharacterized protein (DUF305 family)
MKHARRAPLVPVLIALVALLGLLAGCGGDATTDEPGGFNDADVAFASEMIPHHLQALQLVRMVEARHVDPDLSALAAQIRSTQAVEVQSMTTWLGDWNRPVPSGEPSAGTGRPGAVTAADLAAVEAASGREFEDRWLRLMIRHHEDAIAMARTENQDGRYPYARALAQTVQVSQGSEIRTMRAMLG